MECLSLEIAFGAIEIRQMHPDSDDQKELKCVSLTLDQVAALKRHVVGDQPFVDRLSLGLARRLMEFRASSGDDFDIIEAIIGIENNIDSRTKVETQFRHKPLFPFWHKHYFNHKNLLKNIGAHWNISNNTPNKYLEKMIQDVAQKYGDQPDVWPKILAHKFFIDAI